MPNLNKKRHTLLSQLGFGVTLSTFALMGCAVEAGSDEFAETERAITLGALNTPINNPTGRHIVLQRTPGSPGLDAASNAFSRNLGQNGRACIDCHQPNAAMGISPATVRAAFEATVNGDPNTRGLDPIFRLNDGANGPLARVTTVDDRRRAYSLLLSKGLIRIPLTLPANRDFDVKVTLDPYAGTGANPPVNQTIPAGASPEVSVYRRPLLSANTRFISAVMWDGREARIDPNPLDDPGVPQAPNGPRIPADSSSSRVFQNMFVQSTNATRGHAEGLRDLTAAEANQIVTFQMNNVTAQIEDSRAGLLTLRGQPNQAQRLLGQTTFFGINDSHGGNPTGAAFNPAAMTAFNDAWVNESGITSTQRTRRQSILRGQNIFNGRRINISGVRGVNDALGVATLAGTCTTCHSHPNVGNHTDLLPLDVGISEVGEGDNVLPVFRITSRATGQSFETTDPGRAFITGRFADLNKQKGPTLRALSSRAPYFHNGAADTLGEVVSFYNRRFGIGFNAQDAADLQAFLESL